MKKTTKTAMWIMGGLVVVGGGAFFLLRPKGPTEDEAAAAKKIEDRAALKADRERRKQALKRATPAPALAVRPPVSIPAIVSSPLVANFVKKFIAPQFTSSPIITSTTTATRSDSLFERRAGALSSIFR